jgi:riboflavin kinase/FMN adenylyltransferase
LPEAAREWDRCALSIGNFDGVHRGHQQILDRLKMQSRALDLPSVVLTFEPHPVEFFMPDREPFRLSTIGQKLALLSHYGVAHPTVLRFDAELSRLEGDEFLDRVVFAALRPSVVVVGYDFHFGKDRRGTPSLLAETGREAGVLVEVHEAVAAGDQIISSSRIRRCVRDGEVEEARNLLGRPFAISGEVVHGAGRGQGLGFPTANVAAATGLLPANGVYATYLQDGGHRWSSITNVGVRPTFGESEVTVETFVLDSRAPDDLNLYGRSVSVHLLRRLREERSFESKEALIAQIGRDVDECREVLESDAGDDIVGGG